MFTVITREDGSVNCLDKKKLPNSVVSDMQLTFFTDRNVLKYLFIQQSNSLAHATE